MLEKSEHPFMDMQFEIAGRVATSTFLMKLHIDSTQGATGQ